MEQNFLRVLHEGEIMNETSLDMLKGGMAMSDNCPTLQSCGCYGKNTDLCLRDGAPE